MQEPCAWLPFSSGPRARGRFEGATQENPCTTRPSARSGGCFRPRSCDGSLSAPGRPSPTAAGVFSDGRRAGRGADDDPSTAGGASDGECRSADTPAGGDERARLPLPNETSGSGGQGFVPGKVAQPRSRRGCLTVEADGDIMRRAQGFAFGRLTPQGNIPARRSDETQDRHCPAFSELSRQTSR